MTFSTPPDPDNVTDDASAAERPRIRYKGDNCRTAKQKTVYPHGRTRVTQFIASTVLQGAILAWCLSHDRRRRCFNDAPQTRQSAFWRLLEAGWHALRGDNLEPPPLTGTISLADDHPEPSPTTEDAATSDALAPVAHPGLLPTDRFTPAHEDAQP